MTLRHVVVMKMGAASARERTESAATLAAALEALPPHIAQILALTVGLNMIENPGNWDLALTVDVADEEALEVYRHHPEHLKVAKLIQETVGERCAVDYLV
ncbi:MAG: Dabb family protein [Terrimesophilobacter sp.]